MNIQESRLKRQEVGTIKWWENGGSGIFNYYMGFGKTYTAILIIRAVLERTGGVPITIVVPSEILWRQWNKLIKVHLEEDDLPFVTIYTGHQIISQSLVFSTGLLIVDEIHEFETDDRISIVDRSRIFYKYILGLSGTINHKSRACNYINIIDVVSEQECKINGWISKYTEYNVACELNDYERLLYDRYSENIKTGLSKFGRAGLNFAQYCVGGGKDSLGNFHKPYVWASMWANKMGWRHDLNLEDKHEKEINELWNPVKIIGYARNLLVNIKARKDIVYNAEAKYQGAIEILKQLPERKAIIFNQSTKMADRIGKNVDDCVVYHSKLPTLHFTGADGKAKKTGITKQKNNAINDFAEGKVRRFSTVEAASRGLDIPDINLCIITGGTQNPTQQLQRRGRSTRLNLFNTEEEVVVVNLYIEGSKDKPSVDEKWLKKRQTGATHNIRWVDSIEEVIEEQRYDTSQELS